MAARLADGFDSLASWAKATRAVKGVGEQERLAQRSSHASYCKTYQSMVERRVEKCPPCRPDSLYTARTALSSRRGLTHVDTRLQARPDSRST